MSKWQSLRRSLRRSPRYPHRQSMKITQVGDCLMLQYVFNCMCAPFQHQMPWDPWRQVASKCTCAGANVLESQKGSIASRVAWGIARKPQLASSTPCVLLIPTAISTRSVIARSHIRRVHLDQWQIATTYKHHWPQVIVWKMPISTRMAARTSWVGLYFKISISFLSCTFSFNHCNSILCLNHILYPTYASFSQSHFGLNNCRDHGT